MSETTPSLAFTAQTADIFGYLIKTKLRAPQIVSDIKSPGPKYTSSQTILDGKDTVCALELGPSFSATEGFGRAMTWLQRH
jgi:hypothetical protein